MGQTETNVTLSSATGVSKAVPVDSGIDQGMAWHYGDPLREQTYLEDGTGVVDLSNREVIRITGSQRGAYLNLMATQQLDNLAPGETASTFFLDPKGHIIFFLALVADRAQPVIWGWTEPGQARHLVDHLNSRKMRLDVRAELAEDLAVVWSGPGFEQHLFRAGAPNCLGGRECFVPRAELGAVMSSRRPVGLWAYTAARIAAGVPRFGFETDHRSLPNELGVPSPEVAIGKGCYPGQETVVKTHHRGMPPRRLVRLHLDGSQEPRFEARTELVAAEDGKAIGFAGSTAYHRQLGPIGLGLVTRGVADGAIVLAGGVPAKIEALNRSAAV